MRILIAALGCSILLGCAEPEPQEELANETAATEADAVDPNSMQAIQDAQRARESLPGKQHYERACATCHGGAVKKAPHKDMIGLMTPEAILKTLTDGVMQNEASVLSPEARVQVAEYLSGAALGSEIADIPACEGDVSFNALEPAVAGSWGIQPENRRHIEVAKGGLAKADFDQLEPLWAVSFPGANRVRSQPAFAGGLMFVGSHNGIVYALDQNTGCQVWSYQAAGEVRTGIVVSPWGQTDPAPSVYFGDVLGNVYGLDARTGTPHWRMRADDHPNATITAAPVLHDNTLYVPISSLEVSLAINPEYACCTFRGSVLALDASSGEEIWRRYTIDEEPRVQKQTSVGTDVIGPSGAVVWNTPSLDLERRQLYFGTGENMSSPATETSDALFAVDMDTGKVNWVFQATANDAWNVACDTDTPQNCPDEDGPDFDFGGASLLVSRAQGDLLIAGQKSGFVHALDPDNGNLVWQTQVGRGGIQGGIHFGIAAAHGRVYVPISDMPDGRTYEFPDRPGMHALDVNTGEILWSTLHEDECAGRSFCHPGISQVPSVIGDVVVAGAMDGIVRAYDGATGEIVWRLDSTQAFAANNGKETRGGSFSGAAGPVAYNGKLALSSGYGIYNHMAGNLLLLLQKPTPR